MAHRQPHCRTVIASLGEQMRIVLIGKTAVGKSATANSIVGKKEFLSRASADPVTRFCRIGKGQRMNRDIRVIDTPGFLDTRVINNEIRKEIVKCIAMSSPGPHAFVLVVRPDRFTTEVQETVNLIKETFGNEVMRFMMVLFVRKDDLDEDGVSIEEFVESSPEALKKMLRDCENKYIAFNNRASPDEKEKQARSFIDMVVAIQERNGGQFYSHEIYEQVEKAMKKEEERRIKELEEKLCQERDAIRQKLLAENKKSEDEYHKRIGALEEQIKNQKAAVRETIVRDVGKDRFNIFDAIGGVVSSVAKKCVII